MNAGLPPGGDSPASPGNTPDSGTAGANASALTDFGKAALDALRQYPVLIVAVVVFVCLALVMLVAAPTLGLPGFVVLVVLAIILVGIAMTRRARETAEQFGREEEATTLDTVRYALELDEENREIIRRALRSAAREAATILGIDYGEVRANVFGMGGDGRLHLISAFTHNMANVTELTVSMAPGTGSTGRCYATRSPNIAVRRSNEGTEPDWGVDTLAEAEMRKLVPSLCWIVSSPVVVGAQGASPVWILNVDGLVPVEDSRLATVALALLPYSEALSLLLRTALKEKL